jgi:hypothetical protein
MARSLQAHTQPRPPTNLKHDRAAGFHQKPDQSEMHFKSYGNVGSGAAIVPPTPTCPQPTEWRV